MDEQTGDTIHETNNYHTMHHHYGSGATALAIAAVLVVGVFVGSDSYFKIQKQRVETQEREHAIQQQRNKHHWQIEFIKQSVASCEKAGGLPLGNSDTVTCHFRPKESR